MDMKTRMATAKLIASNIRHGHAAEKAGNKLDARAHFNNAGILYRRIGDDEMSSHWHSRAAEQG